MEESKSVYVADDDEDDRLLIKEAIEEANPEVNVVEASNGVELLEKIKETAIPAEALIVLDMNMPIMNGLETITAIRKDPELSDVPTVMMSTSSNPLLEKRALEAGVNQFVVKPSSFSGLIEIARAFIKRFFTFPA